jgi:hypothetical protein
MYAWINLRFNLSASRCRVAAKYRNNPVTRLPRTAELPAISAANSVLSMTTSLPPNGLRIRGAPQQPLNFPRHCYLHRDLDRFIRCQRPLHSLDMRPFVHAPGCGVLFRAPAFSLSLLRGLLVPWAHSHCRSSRLETAALRRQVPNANRPVSRGRGQHSAIWTKGSWFEGIN